MKYLRAWADFSPDGVYRWLLGREWDADAGKPWMHFTMLNPSKADAKDDDPTIRRCVGFAILAGCRGLLITNLSSFCATDPKDFKKHVRRCESAGKLLARWGDQTDTNIRDAAAVCRYNVAAWGANARHKTLTNRAKEVLELLRIYSGDGVHFLRQLDDGVPEHPLMLPGSLMPQVMPLGASERRLGGGF